MMTDQQPYADNVRHIGRQTCDNCDYSCLIAGGSPEWKCTIGTHHGTIPYTGALNADPKGYTCSTWCGPRFSLTRRYELANIKDTTS
ncbi:hypothetical protein LCGC14_1358890 [marine sediment metagenome]|uniref:Uncharacterized protein n=1 Tax=marine sediment metagenome TaxID=412755 RepID=A0A0F9KUR1_9ZZZZ